MDAFSAQAALMQQCAIMQQCAMMQQSMTGQDSTAASSTASLSTSSHVVPDGSHLTPAEKARLTVQAKKKLRADKDEKVTTVFVGGLRKSTSEDKVAAHFAKFGQVENVDIKRLPDGTSRGFAFVKFQEKEAVDKVIEARSSHMIDNKWVAVRPHGGSEFNAQKSAETEKAVASRANERGRELEEGDAPQEDYEDKWSEKYLSMAAQVGAMQKDKNESVSAAQALEMFGNSAGAPGSTTSMAAGMPGMGMGMATGMPGMSMGMGMPAMGMMNMMGMMGVMNPMMGMMNGMNPMMGMMAAMRQQGAMGMGMPDMQQGSMGTEGGDATGGCFMPGMNPMMAMMAMRQQGMMGSGPQEPREALREEARRERKSVTVIFVGTGAAD